MDVISYSEARASLAKTMDKVIDDHNAVVITRKGQASVVMLSLEDFRSLEETAYLLRSPVNTQRLLAATSEIASGGGQERDLVLGQPAGAEGETALR